jgi:Flp pilus assembly protein TadD
MARLEPHESKEEFAVMRIGGSRFSTLRNLALAGVAALALSACAANQTMRSPDFSGMDQTKAQANLGELAARYKSNPKDKGIIIYYAAALRGAGQTGQAVSVLEAGMGIYRNDADISIAYAKALTADGRFDQALAVTDATISPASPDWNALSVRGAILDQVGRNEEARQLYVQAQTIAPQEASLEANLGLSYAMTSDLTQAEAHLRRAVSMRGSNTKIRQNLALVLGLQGRFDDARSIYSAELGADQVEANMAYIRALLTQQNRWDVIKGDKSAG